MKLLKPSQIVSLSNPVACIQSSVPKTRSFLSFLSIPAPRNIIFGVIKPAQNGDTTPLLDTTPAVLQNEWYYILIIWAVLYSETIHVDAQVRQRRFLLED